MTVYVQDSFTDTNGTSLDLHTPDVRPGSNMWAEHVGAWEIIGNKNTITAALTEASASIDSGVSDCDLSILASTTGTGSQLARMNGLVARLSDSSNLWRIAIAVLATDGFKIVEKNAGVLTTRAAASPTISASTEYTITVQLSGQTITAQLNGANEISYGSATLNETATRHGGCLFTNAAGNTLDDFLVEIAGGTQFNQAAAGTLTTSGAIVKQTQTDKAGTLSMAGSLSKQGQKSLSGQVSSSGNLVNQSQKVLSGILASAGTLIKQTRKSFAGTITSSGALSATKTAFQAVGGALSFAGTIVKQTQKSVSGSISSSGTLSKITSHILSGTLNFTGTITKRIGKSLSGALSFVGTLIASIVAPAAVSFPGKVSPSNSSIYDASGEDELTSNVVGSNTQRDGLSISDSD